MLWGKQAICAKCSLGVHLWEARQGWLQPLSLTRGWMVQWVDSRPLNRARIEMAQHDALRKGSPPYCRHCSCFLLDRVVVRSAWLRDRGRSRCTCRVGGAGLTAGGGAGWLAFWSLPGAEPWGSLTPARSLSLSLSIPAAHCPIYN